MAKIVLGAVACGSWLDMQCVKKSLAPSACPPKTPRATTYVVLPRYNDIFWQRLEKEDKKGRKVLGEDHGVGYFCQAGKEKNEKKAGEVFVKYNLVKKIITRSSLIKKIEKVNEK